MKASEVMTTNVVTVGADATVGEAAKLLFERQISALPVVGKHGELIGIVSEGDLLRRAEVGTERSRSWWLQALASPDTLANEFVKSHARRVADVMTRRFITATPGTPINRDIARKERHQARADRSCRNGSRHCESG